MPGYAGQRRAIATGIVRLLFDDLMFTHYAQLYVQTMPKAIELDLAFRGQTNGLCGAGDAGELFLVTGTHTGSIRACISIWDEESDFGDWEEIVEVSFAPQGVGDLWPWGENPVFEFELSAPRYRVRWNCRAMYEGAAGPNVEFGTAPPDSYERMLWPAEAAPDAIVRPSSVQAGYWDREGFQAQS